MLKPRMMKKIATHLTLVTSAVSLPILLYAQEIMLLESNLLPQGLSKPGSIASTIGWKPWVFE